MCQVLFLSISMGSCMPLDIGEHHTAETVHKLSLCTHFVNCAINYYSIPVRLTLLMCTLTFLTTSACKGIVGRACTYANTYTAQVKCMLGSEVDVVPYAQQPQDTPECAKCSF